MKSSVTILILLVLLGVSFVSCQKDDFQDLTTVNVKPTDDPPQALKEGQDNQFYNPTLVYFCDDDIQRIDLKTRMRYVYWNQYSDGTYTIVVDYKYRLSGRTKFGFYHGLLYVAQSYTDFAVTWDMVSRIATEIKAKGYATGKRTVDSSTNVGLSIYDLSSE